MPCKDKQISLRISVEQYESIIGLHGSLIDVWELGYQKWCEQFPEILQKKAQEAQQLYIQCIEKLGKCYTNAIQKNGVLESLYVEYIATGRDINHPTNLDKSWISGRLAKNNNGHRHSATQFFDYGRKRWKNDCQKRLEVEPHAP